MQAVLWFNVLIFGWLAVLFTLNPKKAIDALIIAWNTVKKSGPLLAVLALILIILESSISVPMIKNILITSGPVEGYLAAIILGAGIHIPLFIAFPLGGELLSNGINAGVISVLITTLVMVHTFTVPIEAKEMGLKYTLWRNGLSLAAAIIIGFVMGLVY
jgi:hypothetical protein